MGFDTLTFWSLYGGLFDFLFGVICANPTFPLILVQLLHLTDGEISFANAIFYTSMLIGLMGISRLSNRFGHRWVLIVSGGMIFIFPLIYAVAKNAYLVWVNNLIGGVIWAGVNNGAINRLMERVPEYDRPAHMALYKVVLNLGMLSGSLLGPALGESIGLREAMFIAAGLRLLGGSCFDAMPETPAPARI